MPKLDEPMTVVQVLQMTNMLHRTIRTYGWHTALAILFSILSQEAPQEDS